MKGWSGYKNSPLKDEPRKVTHYVHDHSDPDPTMDKTATPARLKEKDDEYEKWKANLPKNLQTETEDYNLRGAYEAGMKPMWDEMSQSYHLGSVDVKTGNWLKSMDHPTAWMEYKQYYLTPGRFRQEYAPIVDPEGYFGEKQLKYVKK